MTLLKSLLRPPLRTLILLILVLGILGLAYLFWTPGKEVRDGRHDLGQNGIWLQHGWLGDDSWFQRNDRDPSLFREPARIANLADQLSRHGVRYAFPHLCPCESNGSIAPVDNAQTKRFLDGLGEIKVIPWIGGVLNVQAFPERPGWRNQFISSAVDLLEQHPRLAGVQVNIEPLPSGNEGFLALLEELHRALPDGKILSVAAYPPPTRWHPFPEVHWEEDYFQKVAERCDLMAPMMYDTAIRFQKPYQHLMAQWTSQVLEWSGETKVLIGVPTYDDAGVGYHHPHVENIGNALAGIHAGLSRSQLPENYRGIALYCEWEMDSTEWKQVREEFNKSE